VTLDIKNDNRNAMLDAIETEIGASAVLKIRSGSPPGIDAADSGTEIVSIPLPSNWMANASSGSKAMSGTWQGTATATETAAHFRLYKNDGSTVQIEGTVTAISGGGDIELDDVTIESGQLVDITGFTLNAGN